MSIRYPVIVLGSLLVATAAMADSVPKYDMARTCRLDHAAASGLAVSESMKNWRAGRETGIRAVAEAMAQISRGEARRLRVANTIGGTPSYVGLLTCLQF